MTPDECNVKLGGPVWKCRSCGREFNLTWWNGLSVAICFDSEHCRSIQREKFEREMQEQENQSHGPGSW